MPRMCKTPHEGGGLRNDLQVSFRYYPTASAILTQTLIAGNGEGRNHG